MTICILRTSLISSLMNQSQNKEELDMTDKEKIKSLLAALECALEMMEYVVDDGYTYGGSTSIIESAREAIEKAKGEKHETKRH